MHQVQVNRESRLAFVVYRDLARQQIVRGGVYSLSTRVVLNRVFLRHLCEFLSEKVWGERVDRMYGMSLTVSMLFIICIGLFGKLFVYCKVLLCLLSLLVSLAVSDM